MEIIFTAIYQGGGEIVKVYENYDRDLADTYKMNLEIYLAGIAKRINKIIDIENVSAPTQAARRTTADMTR